MALGYKDDETGSREPFTLREGSQGQIQLKRVSVPIPTMGPPLVVIKIGPVCIFFFQTRILEPHFPFLISILLKLVSPLFPMV